MIWTKNILITGAKGFIGKNLIIELKNRGFTDLFEYDIDTDPSLLNDYCKDAEFVFHLAGVNRADTREEFLQGNYGFTSTLLDRLKEWNNTCPVMISSSIQAVLDNEYGKSKKAGEDLILQYAKDTGAEVFIYRFPNVFGKWCKPNYNSAIATFCYNIARGLPITVINPEVVLKLVYIDDLVEELVRALHGEANKKGDLCEVPKVYQISLSEITDLIYSFERSRRELSIPDMSNSLTKKLYSTFLSYLPEKELSIPLKTNADHRGSFTEFIKTKERGQISVNIIKPGYIKGNHWHHTKCEKFLVVKGTGVIRLRKIGTETIIKYFVNGDVLEVVDIPVGFVHNIINLGETDLVILMWANECFDPDKPDTYYMEV
ncbi:capsular polysaccharide biosynthesis protein CapF [Mobilitalea sibirica]|uniref:Capsular polysaccharide biosynthesis protein CapF n=2 Tax=Mobilitalea sibirica TaxID=1462919 RepID=A0A8J7H0A6_9FIRM|nr:capsular polysaccharide biosynthesis protein CapF [Mobilitalea sibirica]